MEQKPRLWTGDFTLLLVINFLAYICCQSLNNGVPIYVARLGGTTAFSGALILEFSIFAAITRIIAGRLIDTGTRKRIMLFGALIMFLGTIPALIAPGVMPQLAFRALQGIGFGCMHTAAATAAADVLPSERLGEGIGYFGLGQSLGMAIGPTFAVVLTSMVFTESLFVGVAAVAVTLVALIIACTYENNYQRLPQTSAYRKRREELGADFYKPKPKGDESLLESLFVKSALPGAIPMVVSCLGYSIIVNFTSLYGTQLGLSNTGMFFVFAAITMTAVRLFGGRLIDKIRPIRLFTAPVICGIASLVLLANLCNEPMLWLAGALFGLSMGLAFPLMNSVCVKNTVPERWGAASALFGLMNDLGIGLGALLWGAVADVVGFVPVMYGGTAMLLLAYVLALLLFPKES